MAGELHNPADDGARARADDVDAEQVRADALADRIAAYAPAGSDARAPGSASWAEADRLRGERDAARVMVARLVATAGPYFKAALSGHPSDRQREAYHAALGEARDVLDGAEPDLAAEVDRLRGMLAAHGLDPDCSLCAAGHVPARPCAEPDAAVTTDDLRAHAARALGGPRP